MQFETMGLLVVRKTYSIAVACLNPDVLNEAPEDLFGQFLVINEPVTRYVNGNQDLPPVLAHDMQNRLYNPNDFELEYKLVGPHEPGKFFRVKRVRSHEREAMLDDMKNQDIRDGLTKVRYRYPRGHMVRSGDRIGYSR